MLNLVCAVFTFATWVSALSTATAGPDWHEGASVPDGGRSNPYELSVSELAQAVVRGSQHALIYPITATGMLVPYAPLQRVFEQPASSAPQAFVRWLFGAVSGFSSFDEMEAWLGLARYPVNLSPNGHRMGFTLIERGGVPGFTISCAGCHVGELFGRQILGLTNRFPRANDFFHRGLTALPRVSAERFRWLTDASPAETQAFRDLQQVARWVAVKRPVQLGLDTSLAQVSMSLASRAEGDWAEMAGEPRSVADHPLNVRVADSKPAVWWNAKYKNRWLSDGSVVSGNPIFTNFIWNEIGRGTDLRALDQWISDNPQVIQDLTTAVFATEAPKWTDFFSPELLPEKEVVVGEALYLQHCARCHGVYEKERLRDARFAWAERIQTTRVVYAPATDPVDVGTDPGRFLGMKYLEPLNQLEISRRQGIRIKAQTGYVPPPLIGIWARWPYMHNNSIPTLCAVLTRNENRPVTFWARPANKPGVDFDMNCNGYPGTRPPGLSQEWMTDTRKEGLSNGGHDEGVFLRKGRELLTWDQKTALIRYLQTL